MKGKRLVSTVIVAVMLWLLAGISTGPSAEDVPAAAGDEEARQEPPAKAASVQMAEFTMSGRKFKGKVISEDDQMIKIERLGSGEIGYHKELLQDLKRYEVPLAAYYETVADHYAAQTWDFEDDETDFTMARRAYKRALASAPTGALKQRLETKHDHILKDREEWQQEAVRRQELRKAEEEVENARLKKELTEKQLEAMEELSEIKEEVESKISRIQRDLLALVREIRAMARTMEDMEEDIEDLEARWRRRPTVVVYGLRRSYDSLELRVRDLERRMRTLNAE